MIIIIKKEDKNFVIGESWIYEIHFLLLHYIHFLTQLFADEFNRD